MFSVKSTVPLQKSSVKCLALPLMTLTCVYSTNVAFFLCPVQVCSVLWAQDREHSSHNKRATGSLAVCSTSMGWYLPEFLPCWVYCSSKSSRRGKRPPRSAFSPSQPQCRWHRTSRSGHRRFCRQGKELVKCLCGIRKHPKHISFPSL